MWIIFWTPSCMSLHQPHSKAVSLSYAFKLHLLEVGLHHLQKCICQQCNSLRATLPINLHMAVNRERVDEGSIVKLHYMCALELCF